MTFIARSPILSGTYSKSVQCSGTTLKRLDPVFAPTGRDRKLKSYIVCNISQIASDHVRILCQICNRNPFANDQTGDISSLRPGWCLTASSQYLVTTLLSSLLFRECCAPTTLDKCRKSNMITQLAEIGFLDCVCSIVTLVCLREASSSFPISTNSELTRVALQLHLLHIV